MEGKETYSQRHCLNISWTTVSHSLFERFMRSLSGTRPFNMRYSSGEHRFNRYMSCSWPFATKIFSCLVSSYLRSNGHQRIHTGYLQDAERTRTGQTAYQRTSNVHPPDIFIRWRPFEVLNMFKTCKRIRPDKTDITWHGTHEERTRNACERTRTDR